MSLEENKKIAEADVRYLERAKTLSSRSQWVVPKLIQLKKEGRNGT